MYNETTTIPDSPLYIVTNSILDTIIQYTIDISKVQFDKLHEQFDKKHEELVNLKFGTFCLS